MNVEAIGWTLTGVIIGLGAAVVSLGLGYVWHTLRQARTDKRNDTILFTRGERDFTMRRRRAAIDLELDCNAHNYHNTSLFFDDSQVWGYFAPRGVDWAEVCKNVGELPDVLMKAADSLIQSCERSKDHRAMEQIDILFREFDEPGRRGRAAVEASGIKD